MNFNATDKEVELINMVMSARMKCDFNDRHDLNTYAATAILEIFYYLAKAEKLDPRDYKSQKILAKTLTGRLHYEILEFLFSCACDDCDGHLTFENFINPDFKVKEGGE